MCPEQQFWWNWCVNVGVAAATFLVVFIVLFGDWIRARLFSPKLRIEFPNAEGVRTPVLLQWQSEQGLQQRTEDGRYYRARVKNLVRWPNATQVQLYLLRIEEPGPDGTLQLTWFGEVPLQWTHQEIYPLDRTIGPPADFDLCSVVKGKWIQLHPIIFPENLPHQCQWRNPTTLVVTVQARGNEGQSPLSRFQIAWDGKWEDGQVEMSRHLVVKALSNGA
jgi:hypothetical protein